MRTGVVRRVFALLVLFLIPVTAWPQPEISSDYRNKRFELDIPILPLEDALNELAKQTHTSMVFPYNLVSGLQSRSIKGRYTLKSALQLVLKDTSLSSEFVSDNVIAIKTNKRGKSMRSNRKKLPLLASIASLFTAFSGTSHSVESDSPSARVLEEVIVTARKREESFQDVPVVMSAISGEQIQKMGMADLDSLSQSIPQLQIGGSAGGVQGGFIALRGISGPSGNPASDSPVAFNLDGVQIAKTSVRRLGMFDLQGMEVLKGPQALFYGKNSPGGIITLRTGNPTEEFEGQVSAGYEFEAEEWRTEGYISGPISDTVGYRLAGFYSDMDGWMESQVPDGSSLDPGYDNAWQEDYGIRATLEFNPSDQLMIRPKVTYGKVENTGLGTGYAAIDCATPGTGFNAYGDPDKCDADEEVFGAGYGTDVAQSRPIFKANGRPFSEQEQLLAGLEVSYDLTDEINLASITGLYDAEYTNAANFSGTGTYILAASQQLELNEISQEFRIDTDFDSNINVTAGVFYAESEITMYGGAMAAGLIPGFPTLLLGFPQSDIQQDGTAWSVFVQGRLDLAETVQLTLGGRYSEEEKELADVFSVPLGVVSPANALDTSNPAHRVMPGVDDQSWNDFSPEVTLAWQPNDDWNLFASYKQGFMSGGFNLSNVGWTSTSDNSYNPQLVDGFEIGAKGVLLDSTLQLNLAAYTYEITDQQVTTFINSQSVLTNAGTSTVEGVEMDFTYLTPIDGLILRGAASYNKGEYDSFTNVACYGGQTTAQGCVGGEQDLSGTELPNAPEWNLSLGFDYDVAVGDSLELGITGNVSYSDSYITDLASTPNGRMPSYSIVDLSVRLSDFNDTWELALIGRNLGNEYVWNQSTNTFARQLGLGNDVGAAVDRARQVMVRATYKF